MIITGINPYYARVTFFFLGAENAQTYTFPFETTDELFKRLEIQIQDVSRNTKSGIQSFTVGFITNEKS